jgi:signal transduction histidine kinase
MEESGRPSGTQSEHIEQRLTTVLDKNRRLSEQIKRLVRIEYELYQFQEQLDNQVRIYRHLYEVGKELNATLDLGEILQIATQFVLYQLGFERCVALLYDPDANTFSVAAHDGYYDAASRARVKDLRFSAYDPLLGPILADSERIICAEGCDQRELLALGQALEMPEYVAFGLGGEPQQPVGLLIAGNTENSPAYHAAHIQVDSEFAVGLANLVSQVATAIRMKREIQARERRLVRLTADLQRSRERLVTTREEERRRLRRDLHDGLGPTLGFLTLGLDTARRLFTHDPKGAEALLLELKGQTQEAVSDVRRLVYDLRPPALDDLGLIPAIRQQAANHGNVAEDPNAKGTGLTDGKNGIDFSVEVLEDLPPLPAAVEVACYRIAQEAIANVSRHSGARSCRVKLSVSDAYEQVLVLEVEDDGAGIPEDRSAGVGMSSMRERAEELGGALSVKTVPEGGTRVVARLPISHRAEE